MELPAKLSDLLELAVRDVQKCEAEPARFKLHMGNWHKPDNGACVVCMAGAIMAQTIGVPDQEERSVFQGLPCVDDVEPYRHALAAVNELRMSKIISAAKELDMPPLSRAQCAAADEASDLIRRELPRSEYGSDYDDVEDWDNVNEAHFHAPWETYLKAAAVLRQAGL